jgi:DNA-binding response OmpR family regulator
VENGEILRNGESTSALAQRQPRSSQRILLVDDEVLIRKLCARVLNCFGYQTDTANDGAAAWKALQSKDYDLLITDNNMPRVSGVELVKKVRSAQMSLPVILVSGNLPSGELNRNPWLQGVATLAKPFTGDELLGTVNSVLREVPLLAAKSNRCQSSARETSATEQTSYPTTAVLSQRSSTKIGRTAPCD